MSSTQPDRQALFTSFLMRGHSRAEAERLAIDELRRMSETPAPPQRDILALTLVECNGDGVNPGLPQNTVSALMLRSQRTTDLGTLDALRLRIAEHIHMRSLEGRGVRLVDLNRRFHRPATKLQTSITECVEALVESGQVTRLEFEKRTAFVSSSIYNEMREIDVVIERAEWQTIGSYVKRA